MINARRTKGAQKRAAKCRPLALCLLLGVNKRGEINLPRAAFILEQVARLRGQVKGKPVIVRVPGVPVKIQRIAVFSDIGKRDSQMMKMFPEPFANLAQQIGVLVGFQQTLGNLNPPLLLDVKFGHAYILVGKGGAVNAKPLFAAGAHSRVVGHIGIIHYWVCVIIAARSKRR